MTERIEVPALEAGVVRLFALDLPAAEAKAWLQPPEHGPDPLAEVLGADPFDRSRAEVVRLDDLEGMRLSDYLAEGYGIPEAELAPLRSRIDGLTGQAVIVMSRAFGGQAQALCPRAPLRLVARLEERSAAAPVGTRLRSESARGTLSAAPATPAPDRRRRGLLIGLILLLLAALGLAALFGGG